MDDINKIIDKGHKFYNTIKENDNSRFKSWEHCYKSFQEAYRNKNKGVEVDYDYLSLQLSFYLASWGMYRGSSFLLSFDYKVHEYVVRLLLDSEYKLLWDTLINEDKNQDLKKFYNDLFLLINKIKDYYRAKRNEFKLNKHSVKHISDTLVSKIILGTIGCIPAFDRFLIVGMTRVGLAPKKLSKKSIENIIQFYKENFNEFECLRKEISAIDIEYSPMKVFDSCIWQLGFDIKNNLD